MQATFKLPISCQIPGYFHVPVQTSNDLKKRGGRKKKRKEGVREEGEKKRKGRKRN